ncbi:hypothetical protein AB0L06_10565 [Spirillospora sp. NPDC052269]
MIALATPLAMAFPVIGMMPAGASNGITAPQNGSVITSGSQVTVRATYDFAFQMQLRAKTPGSGDTFLTSGGVMDHSLSAPLSLDRNGRYTVYIKGSTTGHVYASSTFTVRIAPSPPSGVSASVSGNRIKVNWNLGLEDDLTGYTVKAPGGGSKSGSVGSLCSGSSCSASIPVGSASGSVSVQVQARRSTGLGGSVASPASLATVSVGGGGNGPNTSVPPGTTVPPSGDNGTNRNTPLTPFNNQSPVTLPSVQPSDATSGFTYPTPQVASSQSPKAENAAASTQLQWGRSIGIALVLLVAAAHLGTWTRRLRTVQAGVSEKGMAARLARSGSARSRVRNAKQHIAQAEAMAKTTVLTPPGPGASAASSGEGTMGVGGVGGVAGGADAGAADTGVAQPGSTAALKALPGASSADGASSASKGTTGTPSVVQGAAANSGPRRSSRRPARLGKRRGGVDVRIADKRAGAPAVDPMSGDSAAKQADDSSAGLPIGAEAGTFGAAAVDAPTGSTSGRFGDAAAPRTPAADVPAAGVPAPRTSAAGVSPQDAQDQGTPDAGASVEGAAESGTRPLKQRDIFSVASAVEGVSEEPDASTTDAPSSENKPKGRRSGRGRRHK